MLELNKKILNGNVSAIPRNETKCHEEILLNIVEPADLQRLLHSFFIIPLEGIMGFLDFVF